MPSDTWENLLVSSKVWPIVGGSYAAMMPRLSCARCHAVQPEIVSKQRFERSLGHDLPRMWQHGAILSGIRTDAQSMRAFVARRMESPEEQRLPMDPAAVQGVARL